MCSSASLLLSRAFSFFAPAGGLSSWRFGAGFIVSISVTHMIRPSRSRIMLLGNLSRTSKPLNRSVQNCGLFCTFRRKKFRGSSSVWFLIMNFSADSVLPNSSISGSSPFGSLVGRRYNAHSANRFLKYELFVLYWVSIYIEQLNLNILHGYIGWKPI